LLAVAVLWIAGNQSGCIRAMVLVSKAVFGDSHITSPFEQQTGVSLCDGKQKVLFVCTAPATASGDFESFAVDLEDEVRLQLKMHGVDLLKSLDSHDVSASGIEWESMARANPEANYILHADIERFSGTEEASPDLLRGRANGTIYAYEIHRPPSHAGNPRVLKVFYVDFQSEYPTSHPVSADQMSTRTFSRRFVEHLAEQIGRTFYDVPTMDAYR